MAGAEIPEEIRATWHTLEDFGFPPEAMGWPFVDLSGKLPEAVGAALSCMSRNFWRASHDLQNLRDKGTMTSIINQMPDRMLIALVMRLTGGAANPHVVKAQIDSIREEAANGL